MQETQPAEIDRLLQSMKTADYGKATESCDLVMKGGVTSGVVYPATICRLAETFRLRSIGGTSAGALAAALAAAAEFERVAAQKAGRPPVGFQRLAEVPEFLGTDANLKNLFQPSKSTAPLFGVLLAVIDSKVSMLGKLVTVFRQCPGETLLAALVALALFVLHLALIGRFITGGYAALAYVLAVVTLIVEFLAFGALLSTLKLRSILLEAVPDNQFGMCTGLETPGPGSPVPLTLWLGDRIDYVAGRSDVPALPADAMLEPLTFGDLYAVGQSGTPGPYPYPSDTGSPLLDDMNARSERAVNLEMVTTDVTAGRPHRLPFSPLGTTKFYYDPEELKHFFPPRVMKRMMKEIDPDKNPPLTVRVTTLVPAAQAPGATTKSATKPQKGKAKTLYPFPSAQHLPVVVAARMSMSFPVLFSAVPLYAVSRQAQQQGCPGGPDTLEVRKTWFSDGGLSSNIPIHFFDGPVPRWPTFALNLRGFPRTSNGCDHRLDPETATDAQKVFLATSYDPDVEIYRDTGNGRLFQFANSIVDAMQNWNDNTLMQLPGYRERTVEIAMLDSEGGLNLVMPKATIDSIMQRGYYAADLFTSTFAKPTLDTSDRWNDHRHIRLRSALLMQSEWTRRFRTAWNMPGSPSYDALIDQPGLPYTIPYAPNERASAHTFAAELADAPDAMEPGVTLSKEPHPSPELRARPRV